MLKLVCFGVLVAIAVVAATSVPPLTLGSIPTSSSVRSQRNGRTFSATKMTARGKDTTYESRKSSESSAAASSSDGDINVGFKVLFHDQQPVSIYIDANLAQPARSPPYVISSDGQNGAAPISVTSRSVGSFSQMWTYKGGATTTASHMSTVAGLDCYTNYARNDYSCYIEVIDTVTGQVKWNTTILHTIPADNHPVAVTEDGSFIAIATTDFVPPLPSQNYGSVLRLFSTHSGTPLGSFPMGESTQSRDVAIAVNVAGLVAGSSVDLVSVSTKKIIDTQTFDFSTGVFCLSPNGQFYAYGFESVYVYENTNGEQQPYTLIDTLSISGSQQYYAGTCSFSNDGTTLVVGWYRQDFLHNQVQSYNPVAKKQNYLYPYPVDVGSTCQNLPVDSQFDDSGAYFVVGSWGSSNQTSPTVAVFEAADKSAPVATYTTPGSVYSVSVLRDSRNGNVYATAVGKHVHANIMGDGGDFYVLQVKDP